MKPLLSLLVAMQRPLRPSETAKLLGLEEDSDEINCLNDAVSAMFPLRNGHYVAFHKSVVDYLVKEKRDKRSEEHTSELQSL